MGLHSPAFTIVSPQTAFCRQAESALSQVLHTRRATLVDRTGPKAVIKPIGGQHASRRFTDSSTAEAAARGGKTFGARLFVLACFCAPLWATKFRIRPQRHWPAHKNGRSSACGRPLAKVVWPKLVQAEQFPNGTGLFICTRRHNWQTATTAPNTPEC